MQKDLFGKHEKLKCDLEDSTSKNLVGKNNKEVSRSYELFAQYKLSQLGFLIFNPPEQISPDFGYTKESFNHIHKMQVKGCRPHIEKGSNGTIEYDCLVYKFYNKHNKVYCKKKFPYICCVADLGHEDYKMFMHKNDGETKTLRIWPRTKITNKYCKTSINCFLAFHKAHNTYNIKSYEEIDVINTSLVNVGEY